MGLSLETTDESLMLLYQKGDENAFAELFKRYKQPVYSYLVRYTGSASESEELFQDVFIKIHRAAPDYFPTAKFKTWLYTIVRNLCIDHYRKQRLRHAVSMDEEKEGNAPSLHETIASEDPSPHQRSSDREIATILEQALKTINADQREVFLMREKTGLKFEEIAEILGVSVNTVKSRMRYALEALRKYLENSGFEDLDPGRNVKE